MKYRVTTTTADRVNGHTYSSARAALTAYNNTREIYARAGYIIADAGNGQNSRAELWIKEGRADHNIEIWPVTDEDTTTPAPAAGSLAGRVAAAVVLLSLTIGQGKPAQIYTNDPAAVLAEVANAGETVTAYTIARA